MKKNKTIKWQLIPLFLLVSIVPLITRLYTYDNHLTQYPWYAPNGVVTDIFLYYKSICVIAIAAVMCVILVYRYITQAKAFRWSYQLLPIGIYAFCTIVSTLFSKYKYFCIHGMTELFESVWVVLGYCVIAFYAYELIQTIEDIDMLMKWLTIGLAIMLVIGLLQAFGHDLFGTILGKKLISGTQYWNSLDEITLAFPAGVVYLTVYNPNYVALYFGLMIPLEIVLLIRNHKIAWRVLYAGMIFASLICLFAAQNRAMVVGILAAAGLSIIILHRYLIRHWKLSLGMIAGLILFSVIFFSFNSTLLDKFTFRQGQKNTLGDEHAVSKIVTGDDNVCLTYNGNDFYTYFNENGDGTIDLHVTDASGAEISYIADEYNYKMTITDERFKDVTVQPVLLEEGGALTLEVTMDGHEWQFQKGEDGTYYYVNTYGKLDKVNNAPSWGRSFLIPLVDERARIWSETFPILKDKLLFGSGPDTFVLEFPQDNYVEKAYNETESLIDVKPHNAYLQIAVQEGVLAAVVVIFLFLWYLWDGIRLYSKASYQNPMEIMGVGLTIALGTHMAVAIINDSNVCVSPLFWLLLGVGMSVNSTLKKTKCS